ncbi:MAG: hydrogenase [Deltaproteobacteria bacterium]|nr:hydrogenase [Deltaproteobacteria bacterium]
MNASRLCLATPDLARPPSDFFKELRQRVAAGARLVSFYGRPSDDPAEVVLTAVFDAADGLMVSRASILREHGFHSLTRDVPAFHIFERELFEQHGAKPHDHPWLKPVRYPAGGAARPSDYPFYKIEGKEVHEVAVGPIHAGVIEPGHFRFMCLGEIVHHLEIQLGYQHRGAEALLLRGSPLALAPLVETLAGDTSVAHAWAYCDALEALTDRPPDLATETWRGVGLELERIAMHLAGLSGMCADIAFMQGASTYGRLRTTAINTSMLLCGSRLGHGWIRPGGVRLGVDGRTVAALTSNLALIRRDIAIINRHFCQARSVGHRLRGVGVVSTGQALELGLVGMAARASGVEIDARTRLRGELGTQLPIQMVVETSGDCWARASLRIREIDESLAWLDAAIAGQTTPAAAPAQRGELAPDRLAISVQEGWRGEVVHCLETDAAGALRHYRVQDPSLRNWFGLALSVRSNEISDFPICNKSFDLSYCGNDL